MFTIKPLYTIKERISKDYHKNSDMEWLAVVILIAVIIITFITGIGERSVTKASAEPIEDYTYDISQLNFGDILKAQIYSLDTKWQLYDLDKLAKAVAIAETGDCTKGYGKTKNNCHGIMAWTKTGRRYAKTYESKEASYKDFKRIWSDHYGSFPDYKMARRWTGNDHTGTWLANVKYSYNNL